MPIAVHMDKIPTEQELDTLLDEIQDESKTQLQSSGSNQASDKTYLFYCESMKPLAIQIQNESSNAMELAAIDWKTFNDGFPDLIIPNTANIRSSDVIFLADLSDAKLIFEQYGIMCALPRYLAKSVKIFVGYFPTGQMDSEEERGRVATANTLARLLSSIPTGANGPVQICICDIHSLQNQFYFTDNILVRLESCMGLIKKEMQKMKHCSVAFPDEGAYKRFHAMFTDWPHIICTKVKDGKKTIAKLKEGEVKDRNVMIVDDLVQSGDTVANCGALMKANGCQSVSCFCSHAVFPNALWRRFSKNGTNEALLDTFYVTNTIPNTAAVLKEHTPFKVLSVPSVYIP
eukprot:288191_1